MIFRNLITADLNLDLGADGAHILLSLLDFRHFEDASDVPVVSAVANDNMF